MKMRKVFFATLYLLISLFRLPAQVLPVHEPEIMARSAYVIELHGGRVLYGKDPDLIWPPASLTKLMTLHLVWSAIERGAITADDYVPVSKSADWHTLPKGSSLMFIETGQLVTVRELMQGLAVSSGNDAAIALAEYISGSLAAFVDQMNHEAEELGYSAFHFFDASGLSARNTISARQCAEFCSYYIKTHPMALAELHSLVSFIYPKRHNVPAGSEPFRWEIEQQNRNHLLGRMEGITGLKTGYIDESLFNVALSGSQNGLDIVAVILGTPGELDKSGYMNRTLDSAVLVTWVFNNFSAFRPEFPVLDPLTVWYGRKESVGLICEQAPLLVLSDNERAAFYTILDLPDSLKAPVAAGQEAGVWKGFSGDRQLFALPVHTAGDVQKSRPLGVFGDWVKKLFR
ncbi:MAG: D-alanyl-D-alanine carboxypeptidase [Spirochaetales bacterium]|nr:D-alanyl-D-alanine carboxypeptidase [Spirochaetales bacterium]